MQDDFTAVKNDIETSIWISMHSSIQSLRINAYVCTKGANLSMQMLFFKNHVK